MMKNYILKTALAALMLLWPVGAFGVEIRLGNEPPLAIDQMRILYQETFDTDIDPSQTFWGVLDIGQKQNDPWAGVLAKGAYGLTNTGKAGAVRYYYHNSLDDGTTLSECAVSVEVAGTFNEEISGAGLIYEFDPTNKYYFGFVIGRGQTYAVYQRNKEGMRRVVSGESPTVRPHQSNRLTLVPQANIINFYINGQHVAKVGSGTPPRGAAGIMAISSGFFLFDNFALYEAKSPAARSTSAVPTEQSKENTVEQKPKQVDQQSVKEVKQSNEDREKQLREQKQKANALFN